MKRALFSTALLLLCVMIALPAGAQNRRASGEFGVHAGYTHFDADIDDNASFGAHIGINITDHVEVEFDYTFVDTEFDVVNLDVDASYFSLGYVYNHHPDGDLTSPHVPYFTTGIGTVDYDVAGASVPDADVDYMFIGIGYRYFWNDVFGVRWDVRALISGDEGDIGDVLDADNVDVSTFVGLTWVFGGRV